MDCQMSALDLGIVSSSFVESVAEGDELFQMCTERDRYQTGRYQ